MSDDPRRVASILIQSSTAASLTQFGISLARPLINPISSPQVQIPPDDHPVYMLIGKVAAKWSHLEHTLDLIIWDLAGIEPEKGACITAQMMGATNRYRTIIALLKQRKTPEFEKLAQDVEGLMRRTFDPQEERNRIVHDAWYLYEDQTAQFRAMPPKDPRFGVCAVDVEKIEATVKAAEMLDAKAGALWRAIHTAIASVR